MSENQTRPLDSRTGASMKQGRVGFACATLFGSILVLGCFLALALLFAMHGAMAMNTRYP